MSDDFGDIVRQITVMTGGVMVLVTMVAVFSGGLVFFGFDSGTGEQIGYISEVESNGIFWRLVEIRLISAEPTFSDSDTVWYYGSSSQEVIEKAVRCLKTHDVITVKYKTYRFVKPWDYSHRTLIEEIVGECNYA